MAKIAEQCDKNRRKIYVKYPVKSSIQGFASIFLFWLSGIQGIRNLKKKNYSEKVEHNVVIKPAPHCSKIKTKHLELKKPASSRVLIESFGVVIEQTHIYNLLSAKLGIDLLW